MTPVANAQPECGTSAVKCIKTRILSSMKNDLLNSLLLVSIKGSAYGTSDCENLTHMATVKYEEKN